MLKKIHIENIRTYIVKLGVTDKGLQNELVDHICCEVELTMAHGLNFNEAYNRVRQNLNIQNLEELQRNSILSINADFSKRKKSYLLPIAGFGLTLLVKLFQLPLVSLFASITMIMIAGILINTGYTLYDTRKFRPRNIYYSTALILSSVVMAIGTVIVFGIGNLHKGVFYFSTGIFILSITTLLYYLENHIANKREYIAIGISGIYVLLGIRFFIVKWLQVDSITSTYWLFNNEIMTPAFAWIQLLLFIPLVLYKGMYKSKLIASLILVNTIITFYLIPF